MESVSRVYGFIDNTRDLTLDAARDTGVLRKASSTPPAPSLQLKKLLESKHEQEILSGLRRAVSLTQNSSPDDLSYLLPTVLKNISSPNTHIRKLVYIFLLYNAESDQDTALLAINSIQKALSASDAHLRALALRTISSLKVPVIAQIVSLGIKRGAGDMSPIVRRTAAYAIPKCWRLDPSTIPQLETYLEQLLGDRQYFVAGAAVIAFNECCPDRVDLVHAHYRTLVAMLIDMDEWSQLATIKMATSYARRCFPRPKEGRVASTGPNDFASSSSLEADKEQARERSGLDATVQELDPDLELLLRTSQSLLTSRSSAVVVAVASMYLSLAPNTQKPSAHLLSTVGPLVSLLRGPPSVASVALQSILHILTKHPGPFVRYIRHFLIKSLDDPPVASHKLEALSLLYPLAPSHAQSLILAELTHAASSPQPRTVSAAIAAIGRCSQTAEPDGAISQRCLRLLLAQVSAPASAQAEAGAPALASSEALTQIRHIIQTRPEAHTATVIRLAKDLDTTRQPAARASIVWLVGEFAGVDVEANDTDSGKGNVAADVLRILAKGFADEDGLVKRQILVLAAKVYLNFLNKSAPDASPNSHPSEVQNGVAANDEPGSQIPYLYAYIHHLTRYDTSYTLRDLARTHRSLLPVPSLSTAPSGTLPTSAPSSAVTTQLATLLLTAPKPAPVQSAPATSTRDFRLGSASLIIGDAAGALGLPGYEDLPDWVEPGHEPDARLRDIDGVAPPAQGRAAATASGFSTPADGVPNAAVKDKPIKAPKNLDDWLAEDDTVVVEGEESSGEEYEAESEDDSEEDSSEEDEQSSDNDDDDDEQDRLMS